MEIVRSVKNNMQEFTRRMVREEQGSYIEVPFELPEGVEVLRVWYKVERYGSGECVVDLAVKDSFRIRGWSGSARDHFFISREKATPGYLPGSLTPGNWAVILGAYRIPAEGCLVTVTIEFQYESPRWLKGDLHTHSVHSDGAYQLSEIVEIVEKIGLDFIGLTDHNTTSQNYACPKESNLVFIPGLELTTNRGHCNVLGVRDPIMDFRVTSYEELRLKIKEAKEKGAKISLNHPHDSHCGWHWDWNIDYDWVEVWNGPWRKENQLTLQWWQEKLTSGKRLVAVGGSDFHRPHPYIRHGMPTNWVYSRSRDMKGILEAIDQGHLFISYSPEGPIIELHCGDYMMGDLVPLEEHRHGVEVSLHHLREGDRVKIISNQGLEKEIPISGGKESIQLSWEVKDRIFMRVEIWRYFPEVNQVLLAAMSNPIYFSLGAGM